MKMESRSKRNFIKPMSRRLNLSRSNLNHQTHTEVLLRSDQFPSINGGSCDLACDDDNLAPVMPAIDAVQQLIEQESKNKVFHDRTMVQNKKPNNASNSLNLNDNMNEFSDEPIQSTSRQSEPYYPNDNLRKEVIVVRSQVRPKAMDQSNSSIHDRTKTTHTDDDKKPPIVPEVNDEDESVIIRNNPLDNLITPDNQKKQDEYEFIPKSAILDVYSNDPEVKRFLKQLHKIGNECGFNEQDYKCYSCRRPIGMVFGQSKLCHFDGHHYCLECHLGEKSTIPARILCNWDFTKYPISKRNQHFLNLISNEPMFEIRKVAPLLYKTCPELRKIEELRSQAFFIRSYCFTCVQDSISIELTKLVWPREHLIKQTALYSLEDLIQIKTGTLKNVLQSVITFGRQHVMACVLCCQKGFICELCKSSQIIYPFDTESVYRCHKCHSVFHKTCFSSKLTSEECPRCKRLKARRGD